MSDEPDFPHAIDLTRGAPHAGDDAPAGERSRPEWFDLTDTGNAYRMVHYHRDALAYVEGWGWLAYDGKRWSRKSGAATATLLAIDTAHRLRGEADALFARAKSVEEREAEGVKTIGPPASALRKRAMELKEWGLDSQSASRLAAMLRIGQAMMAREAEDFDRDPLVLNVANGTLRIRKEGSGDEARVFVVLDRHDPADRITRVCAAPYEPNARAPAWEAHIERSMPKAEERSYLQRLLGYCATGYTGEQVAFFWQGRGADGKSTTANIVRRTLGDYGATADVATFLDTGARAGDKASPDLAKLSGDVRFVSVSEPPKGAKLDEGRLKSVTGGAPIATRFLNKELFEYSPRWKLCLECNVKPAISGADDGIWRRIELLEWTQQLAKEKRIKGFEDRLFAESAGVLRWLVDGVRAYLTEGLASPDAVRAAVTEYRAGASTFKQWLVERCERVDGHLELSSALYADYSGYCEGMGVQALSQNTFSKALGDEQVRPGQRQAGTGKMRRSGLRLLPAGTIAAVSESIVESATPQGPVLPDADAPSWTYEADDDGAAY